jgi:hypothetical protein
MSLGTGPQALLTLFEDNWQATRAGRGDIPPMYDTQQDFELQKNVVVPLRDREESGINLDIHDILHCYHPEGNPPTSTDNGYKEERLVETVQVDVVLTDRTDHSLPAGEQRLSARERMVGDRDDLGTGEGSEYSGILGEVRYILETVRRDLAEWDTVGTDMVNLYLGNSNANASFVVELEHIARNTVQ